MTLNQTERAAATGACDGGQPVRDGAHGASLTQPAVAEISPDAVSPGTHTSRHVPAGVLHAIEDAGVSSLQLAPGGPQSARRAFSAREVGVVIEAQRAKMVEDAEKLRAAVDAGGTVVGAARALGMSKQRGKMLASRFGIKAAAEVIERINAENLAGSYAAKRAKAEARAAQKRAQRKAEREKRRAEAPPNPKLTKAQNANIALGKARNRAFFSSLRHVPPPPQAEADRLIAEHIARHGVTVCPPAASPEKPLNAGLGWGRGR